MPDQSSEKDLRLAVLIDADNASRTAMKDVMAEVAVYGTPTIKRIYGDWTSPNMSTWKSILLETAITPIQQYSYTTGKNATDSAMIIDAMDILYSGNCDGFVLVSSDSDFTRLATRLREAGMKVYGMGEKKNAQAFHRGLRQICLHRGHPGRSPAGGPAGEGIRSPEELQEEQQEGGPAGGFRSCRQRGASGHGGADRRLPRELV